MSDLELWYRQPARQWTEALPIGNGRLGAMVFGGVGQEHLQLNEDTLWAGGPYSQVSPDALAHLDEVRALIFAGRYAEAEALADEHLMSRPLKQMPYQPAGDLWLDFGPDEATNYRRSLDLDSALAITTYASSGVCYRREVFASPVDGMIVMHLSASARGKLSFALRLTSEQSGLVAAIGTDCVQWLGTNREAEGIPGQLSFAIRAEVRATGGEVNADGTQVIVSNADEVVILIDAATSFVRYDDVSADPVARIEKRFTALGGKDVDTMLTAHIAEHRRLFRRLSIDLGDNTLASLPTDERIARDNATSDPGLAALYLQYARYLMLSSSRPGTQPANLQGIWNDLVTPPWGSKYTTNINLEMNYWLPDPANLGECMEPLVIMAEELAVAGQETAAKQYGARGWALHHNTDLWRSTGPIDGAKWGLWPTGGAWLCAQLWDHLQYEWSDDLARRLLPVFVDCARFILDILVAHPATGELVTNPSLSPENVHPFGAALCAGPTMDNAIIRDLFEGVLDLSARLGQAPDVLSEIRAALPRLPAYKIGRGGQLQEWLEDWDLDVPEIHHRHVSHLYGLYPSQQINPGHTPDLAAAARRSLEIRGDDATGWGIGWRINLWARLRDGDHAHAVLSLLLGPERTYPNMFDAHPPFQIDGNFGGAAGILEMLVQSDGNDIHLLPALPAAWPTGSLRGVRARGGLTIDLEWRGGALVGANILSDRGGKIVVAYRSNRLDCLVDPGKQVRLTFNGGQLAIAG